MKYYLWFMWGTAALMLTACKSKELTRGKAEELLKKNKEFATELTVKIPIGNMWVTPENEGNAGLVGAKTLTDKGIAKMRPTGLKHRLFDQEWVITLTPTGESHAKSWTRTQEKMPNIERFILDGGCYNATYHNEACHSVNGVVYSVLVARRSLKQVTGIAVTSDNVGLTVGEFDWDWEFTPDGILFSDRVPKGVKKGKATFQLYDDGWRIKDIELHG